MQQVRDIQLSRKDHMFEYVKGIEDAFGCRVDPGILETVVYLNLLNIPTTQSCEGHLDHGMCAPWIDVGADVRTELLEQEEEIRQLARERYKTYGKDDQEAVS